VSDVANLIERALTDRWQGTINVASPEFISLKELVAKISNHMRIEPNLNYLPDKMPPTIIPSLDKLRSVYQNMSFLSINQGLERYLKGESYSR
jgi:NAD dependent epimerase/dehydratase family enzyme